MNVLLATDGSESAHAACRFIAQARWNGKNHLTILTVEQAFGGVHGYLEDLSTSHRPCLDAEAACHSCEVLAHTRSLLQPHFHTVSTRVHLGTPAREILSAAEDVDAGLVVLGHRDRRPLSQWVLGSAARAVVDHAPCSVLVVPPHFHRLRRVLFAFDVSEEAAAALTFLCNGLVPDDADVTVLSVAETVPPMAWPPVASGSADYEMWLGRENDRRRVEASRRAEAAAQTVRESGKTAVAAVSSGSAPQEIVKAVQRCEADLLVLGAHSRAGLLGNMMGNTARAVTGRGACATLVVRSSTPSPEKGAMARAERDECART